MSHTLEDPNIPPDEQWTLLLDFTNAFNNISRDYMFEEFRSHVPAISAWMENCYAAQPILHLGEDMILSCCGVQQGDPLGPLGFALTLQPIAKHIKEEVPGLRINVWYLDDGTLCSSPHDLVEALKIIEEDGPGRGLHLNRAKSLLYIPLDADTTDNLLPPVIPITRDSFNLFGCPIGPPSFCESAMLDRVEKVKATLSKLPDIEDSQMEIALLRSCLALPKVAFSLRTFPPCNVKQATASFDNIIREALADLAGGPLSEWSWLKASLPSKRGDLNIRRASLHAPAAYIGSLEQSKALTARILGRVPEAPHHLTTTVSALADAAARPDWVSL